MLHVLNGEEVELPDALIENEDVFRSVVNIQTWNLLSDEDRQHLLQYIPKPPHHEDNDYQEDTVMMVLSSDEKLKFGNPVHTMYSQLKEGMLLPKVAKMRKKCQKLKIKNYKMSQKEYYRNLLQEILVSRQALLEKMLKNGPSKLNGLYKRPSCGFIYPKDEKVRKKYNRILNDIGKECGDDGCSSDEEDLIGVLSPVDVDHYKIPAKMQTRVVPREIPPNPKRCTTHWDDVSAEGVQHMVTQHRKKRLTEEEHPELDTTNISLADVIIRCNISKKTGKGKTKNPEKADPVSQISSQTVTPVKAKAKDAKFSLGNENVEQRQTPKANDKKNKDVTKRSSSSHGYPKMGSFFSLLGYFFEQEREKKCTSSKLEEKVETWQSHKSSELNGWKTLYPSWKPLIKYAAEYMSGKGTASLLHDFVPLVTATMTDDDLSEDAVEEWTWTGPEHENDEVILPLFNHWLETLSQSMSVDTSTNDVDEDRQTIDTTRTAYIVETSTDEEKESFRKQEKERYSAPHKPYIYKIHDYQSIVGPVKGVFSNKDFTCSKAREHAMLVSERPPYVTILCLVKDAVARLPNGEGTRAEVCILLKDSQFLNSEATDAQIHSVVSGALDRLHSEKDPCVRYDGPRKLWVYLHRTRSIEEFERIHDASAAAALAKKQIDSKSRKLQRAAKHKKLADEISEKMAKENEAKNPPITTDAQDVLCIAMELSEKSLASPKQDETKKKASKRKKSLNEITAPRPVEAPPPKIAKPEKLPKPDGSRLSLLDDINLNLENEALMATQSILNDDDLFGFDRSDMDLNLVNTTSKLACAPIHMGFDSGVTGHEIESQQELFSTDVHHASLFYHEHSVSNDSLVEADDVIKPRFVSTAPDINRQQNQPHQSIFSEQKAKHIQGEFFGQQMTQQYDKPSLLSGEGRQTVKTQIITSTQSHQQRNAQLQKLTWQQQFTLSPSGQIQQSNQLQQQQQVHLSKTPVQKLQQVSKAQQLLQQLQPEQIKHAQQLQPKLQSELHQLQTQKPQKLIQISQSQQRQPVHQQISQSQQQQPVHQQISQSQQKQPVHQQISQSQQKQPVHQQISQSQQKQPVHQQILLQVQPQQKQQHQQPTVLSLQQLQQLQQHVQRSKMATTKVQHKATPTGTTHSAVSLQTLSQFITSKIQRSTATASGEQQRTTLSFIPNLTGKGTIKLIQQNPYQIQVSHGAKQNNDKSLVSIDKQQLTNLSTPPQTQSIVSTAQAYQVLDVKGNPRSHQIIVSKTATNATASNHYKKVNVVHKPIHSGSAALNQYITMKGSSIQSPSGTSASNSSGKHASTQQQATSIQAMMKLSGKPKVENVLENQAYTQRQLASATNLKPGSKIIRIPKALVQGKTSPLQEGGKTICFHNPKINPRQQLQSALGNKSANTTSFQLIGTVNRPVIAPLKITLPKTGFAQTVHSPVRLPSPGQQPSSINHASTASQLSSIRLSSPVHSPLSVVSPRQATIGIRSPGQPQGRISLPNIRISTTLNPDLLKSSNSTNEKLQ